MPIRLPALLLSSVLCSSHTLAAPDGAAIYREHCADCHGANGEGVADAFERPLVGDKSLVELTSVITRTMPEGDADAVVGEEAEAVAKYVFDAFYSKVAQARNRPARVALSRLTNRQYEHAVTDLLASFTGVARHGDERGLEARYHSERRVRGRPVFERTDPTVDFDFGESTPDPNNDKFKAEQFSIRWEGSVLPPETGEYEFVVVSENGARLWVNDDDNALIDAWVKSGNDTEYRGTIRLLGGRAYRLRLEFFTFKERTASIRLKWRPPHGVEELVPQRCLTPRRLPETFVVTTPFPPDDASEGYVRGTTVSKEWDAATTAAAIEVADHVVRNLARYSGARSNDGNRREKVRDFLRRFVERAFRRPLGDATRAFFVDRWFEGEFADEPVERIVKRVVVLALKSPRFLYREPAGGTADEYDVAAALAFGLWDSLPDDELLRAAREKRLSTREQVAGQARRMTRDPRATAKLRTFLESWLKLDHLGDVAKDDEVFPGFDERTVADLRTSLDLAITDWLASEKTDFRDLLRGNETYVNGRLAGVLGVDLPADAGFERVELDGPRAGLLTHPLLLAGLAYDDVTSPIHRGVFLARGVLGRRLRPPPDAFTPLPAEEHPEFTTRQRIEFQTKPTACAGCHGMINPLGFPLEQFDAIGRFRETEAGKPIDATGSYLGKDGKLVEFDGAAELARFLADSPEVHAAFAEQLFQHTAKQPVQAFGSNRLETLRETFAERGFDVRDLLVECATTAALHAGNPPNADASSADRP